MSLLLEQDTSSSLLQPRKTSQVWRHDLKIVDWDATPQPKQTQIHVLFIIPPIEPSEFKALCRDTSNDYLLIHIYVFMENLISKIVSIYPPYFGNPVTPYDCAVHFYVNI